MTEEEFIEKFGKEWIQMKDNSIWYRGLVLDEIVHLEGALNEYLTRYFCGDEITQKSMDMHLLLWGDERITLGNKLQIFYFLATKYDKIWFDSYKSIRPKQPKRDIYNMKSDLTFVIEERNVFAHRTIDWNPLGEYEPKGSIHTVRFLKLKNEIKSIDYDLETLATLTATIRNLRNHFELKLNPTKNTLPPSD